MSRAERPYRATVRHPVTHRQVTIRARTERELESYLHRLEVLRTDLQLELTSEQAVDGTMGRMQGRLTLDDAAGVYRERRDLAETTSRNASSALNAYAAELRGRQLYELDAGVMTRWIENLKGRNLEPSTISYAWHVIRAIVRYQMVIGRLTREPWGAWHPAIRGASHPRRLREAARDTRELERFLQAARRYDEEAREAGRVSFVEAMATVAAFLGVRQGELAGLRWTDVDEPRGVVLVARQWTGQKTKQRRVHELRAPEELFALLRDHRAYLAARDLHHAKGPVFPSSTYSTPGHPRARERSERPLTPREMREIARLAELPSPERWTSNSLRDTFATLEQQDKQGDLRALSDRTRHASIASLARYLRSRTREPAAPGFTLPGRGEPKGLAR